MQWRLSCRSAAVSVLAIVILFAVGVPICSAQRIVGHGLQLEKWMREAQARSLFIQEWGRDTPTFQPNPWYDEPTEPMVWPPRASDGAWPSAFPPDGFYDADIASIPGFEQFLV